MFSVLFSYDDPGQLCTIVCRGGRGLKSTTSRSRFRIGLSQLLQYSKAGISLEAVSERHCSDPDIYHGYHGLTGVS